MLEEGGGLSRRELAEQLLLFLQLLQHWVIADAVKAGALCTQHNCTSACWLLHVASSMQPVQQC
jgi:hypothetical protein